MKYRERKQSKKDMIVDIKAHRKKKTGRYINNFEWFL